MKTMRAKQPFFPTLLEQTQQFPNIFVSLKKVQTETWYDWKVLMLFPLSPVEGAGQFAVWDIMLGLSK